MSNDRDGFRMSWIALNRIAEEKARQDPEYRRDLERKGKLLLSKARRLTDAELVEQLRAIGIELDKTSYARLAEHALSAQDVHERIVTDEVRRRFKHSSNEDWVWLALTVLWERWFPELPSFERLDDRMQEGYALLETNHAAACEKWLQAWEDFLRLSEKGGFKSIRDFDDALAGTQIVFNWVQDFELELGDAAFEDARWHWRRIELCEQFLQRFESEDSLLTENMRRSMAEALFSVGERAKSDALFEQWLKSDPQWGWGWIGWSDCYSFLAAEAERDLQRAEAVLLRGLAVPDVRDRADLLDRLADLYHEKGRHDEAERVEQEMATGRQSGLRGGVAVSDAPKPDPGGQSAAGSAPAGSASRWNSDDGADDVPAPIHRPPKAGRNDPCPCGSGKKYKKCCLPKDQASARAAAANAQPVAEECDADDTPALADQPELEANKLEAELQSAEDSYGKPKLPLELEAKLEQLWDNFEGLNRPTPRQMDEFIGQLLALPPEATDWSRLMHQFAELGHPDLPGVFRRIAAAVPHTKDTDMPFFYWAAAEEFFRHKLFDALPEVASEFKKLDLESYDPDALVRVQDWLLAAGFDTETLELAEHFLPIERVDERSMPFAVPNQCGLIFELRVGELLRCTPANDVSPETLAEQLRLNIEDEVNKDMAMVAARVATGCTPAPAWTRAQFDLVRGDIRKDDQAWQDCLRLFGTLIRVADHAWQREAHPPGCAVYGLSMLVKSACLWRQQMRRESKMASDNLLDYLHPSGLEERLAQSCPSLIGVNVPRVLFLLGAHELLARFATRHQLISPDETAQTATELKRLRRELDALM